MSTDGAIGRDAVSTAHAEAYEPDSEPNAAIRELRGTNHLTAYRVKTYDHPRDAQFEAWRNNFASMLEFDEPDDARHGFDGNQIFWDLGSLAFSRIRTDALKFASLPGHTRRDPLDHWALTMPLHGSISTVASSGAFEGDAGMVQVHSLGRTFKGSVTTSEMLMMLVPRDFDPEVAAALNMVEFSALNTGMGHLLSDFFVALCKSLPTIDDADLSALVAATRAMILACTVPSDEHLEAAREPIATVLRERAHQIIQSRLYDPTLGAMTLSRTLGVSRSRLYRLFEPYGGVIHYIQRRRLLGAHAALADANDDRRIIDIAEELCFSDGTEFSRAFKREFGCSPTDVRSGRSAAFPSRPTADLQAYAPEERFGVLLRRLHG